MTLKTKEMKSKEKTIGKCKMTFSGKHIFYKMGMVIDGRWVLHGYGISDNENKESAMVWPRCIACGMIYDGMFDDTPKGRKK